MDIQQGVISAAVRGLSVAVCAGLVIWAASAGAQTKGGVTAIDLPPDRVEFRPGPNVDVVRSNCTICHSAQYVYMQPPLTLAQWKGEVAKMRKVFGAPVQPAQDDMIAEYLFGQNGKR